ncbi:MAG: hypothetical protein MJZ61_01535 [Bacteroidales bacterium]|nr:hypothetical protein [Bacteroidales bacterium]
MDESGVLNSKFVTLRPHINEEGISGQLIDRIGVEVAVADGAKFIRTHKDGTPAEKLSALAIASVGELRNLSVGMDKVDVLNVPSSVVSAHAEIRIYIDGELVTGNSTNFKLKFYLNSISRILSQGLLFV